MKWVIQDNLYNEDGYVRFIEALDRLGEDYTVVKVVPFAYELIPDVEFDKDQKVLVMGSDSLIKAAQRKGWWPGAFTNDNFDHRAWVKAHGKYMLNYEAEVLRFGDVCPPKDGHAFFIRPAIDFKIFAGTVITPENFLSWQEKAVAYGDTLNGDTEVIVSPVKDIQQEFRYFVVNGQIVTRSLYKVGNRVTSSVQVDYREADEFAIGAIQTWEPDYAYVIDVAKTPEGFKIIEYNCINASGFYAADCLKIVASLSQLVNKNKIGSLRALADKGGRGRGITLEGNKFF